ncbi:MAG: molecular chaperone DnaK [Lachnospiraceae bacterium]|nr:molecular chaperone DnaK [Lachnospiraceae bacterium]
MGYVLGIDLGTTNSCMSVMENGHAVIIPNAEGRSTTPSVVAFTKDGSRLVGDSARRQAAINPQRTISSIKREMGSDWKMNIDGHSYAPPEISAMILQKLKADAEAYLGGPVDEAVITVPAYFSDAQRQATRDAGQIAGLRVNRIINEPTSAALAYGLNKEEPQKIMVYDLGGGTFDVSILDISHDVIQVLSTAGNSHLGGDDFDACRAKYLVESFRQKEGIDLIRDASAMARIREASEKAKIELSQVTSTQISLPFLYQTPQGPRHMDLTLTRDVFNRLTAHLVDKTEGPVKQAMQDAGISRGALSKVLLVGGSTRIPAVQEKVRSLTGLEPFKGINPDECVALGACIQGGVLSGKVGGLLLIDVASLSLGIETVGDVYAKIIERNTSLPVQHSQVFTTAANFQSSVEINVLQGENPVASANRSLGRFRLEGIRRALAGVPKIEVTFAIDANGIVHVTARDQGTGNSQQITVSGASGMSQSEIHQAMRDAEAYAASESRKKKQAAQKDRAESMLSRARRATHRLKGDERQQMEDAIRALEHALGGTDMDQLELAMNALDLRLHELGIYTENAESVQDDGAIDV